MSWHDSARSLESESDTALREEMRSLLGMVPRKSVEAEPTPEWRLLADDLRREARRRTRTTRKSHSWMLLAAALPFALVLGGVSVWGVGQKHRAEGYATAVHQRDLEIQRMADQPRAVPQAAPTLAAAPSLIQMAAHRPHPHPRIQGKELVIPVERAAEPMVNDTQRVKGH